MQPLGGNLICNKTTTTDRVERVLSYLYSLKQPIKILNYNEYYWRSYAKSVREVESSKKLESSAVDTITKSAGQMKDNF